MVGEEDASLLGRSLEELESKIPHASRVVVPDAAHSPQLREPGGLARGHRDPPGARLRLIPWRRLKPSLPAADLLPVQTQAQPRFRKRIPCSVQVGGRRHSGLVLNVSRGGLSCSHGGPEPGAGLAVELQLGAGAKALELHPQVVWRRVVAPHLRTIQQGGVGLRIRRAPEPFYTLLMEMQQGDSTLPPRAPAASQRPSPRSRPRASASPRGAGHGTALPLLTLSGASEAEVRDRALAQSGHGWTILEVERID